MKFLIDAQLPRRLVHRLRETGHEAIHTLDLPLGNRTADGAINQLSLNGNYIVVTKDADFVNSFIVQRQPYKLLLISTGNIKNNDLEKLFVQNMTAISKAFETHYFVELNQTIFVVHE